jgi:hypothetical protein
MGKRDQLIPSSARSCSGRMPPPAARGRSLSGIWVEGACAPCAESRARHTAGFGGCGPTVALRGYGWQATPQQYYPSNPIPHYQTHHWLTHQQMHIQPCACQAHAGS